MLDVTASYERLSNIVVFFGILFYLLPKVNLCARALQTRDNNKNRQQNSITTELKKYQQTCSSYQTRAYIIYGQFEDLSFWMS